MKHPVDTLENLSEMIDYGFTASATAQPIGPKFLRITDIQNGDVNWNAVPFCDCANEDTKQYALKSGDIVFARTGATTGKSFLVRECPDGAVFASYLIRVRPGKELHPGFLSHFFNTPRYWQQITKHSAGSTQPGVNSTKLKELIVPVPPLAEQKRIAATLDQADATRRKRQHALQLADDFLRATFLDIFGDPVRNPKKWPVVKSDLLLADMQYGTSEKCDAEQVNGSLPVLRIPNIIGEGVSWSELKYANLPAAEVAKLLLRKGDIIFVRTNGNPEYIGRCAVYDQERPALFASYLIRARLRDDAKCRIGFYKDLISFPTYRSVVLRQAKTTAGNYNISTVGLKSLAVIVPPIEVQDRYLAVVSRMETQKQRIAESQVLSGSLFNSLVQRAFRGEL